MGPFFVVYLTEYILRGHTSSIADLKPNSNTIIKQRVYIQKNRELRLGVLLCRSI